MAQVELEHVGKIYPGNVRAVDDFNLVIEENEFLVLVGPSGCGKSTTLRMVAGLEEISEGTIRIGDRVVNAVAPKDRDIAMVFQNYALYPHMTVYKNMAFGLMLRRANGVWDNLLGMFVAPGKYKQARAERADIDRRVRAAAEMLGITELLDRKPSALSGGQRQRVAVGRAIVREPKAFLFDEPLSNLDAKLRVEMRAELKRLRKRVETTTIYVTHDQEEAMTLGDRVVVMKDGLTQQIGTPFDTYDRPVNRFVAGFVGTPPMNFLEGTLVTRNDGMDFDEGDNRLPLCAEHAERLAGRAGQRATIGIRPEVFSVNPKSQANARLSGTVSVVEPLGDRSDVHWGTERHPALTARVDARHRVEDGQAIEMHVDMTRVHFFERDGNQRNISLS